MVSGCDQFLHIVAAIKVSTAKIMNIRHIFNSELQARYVTALIKAEIPPLPSPEEMDKHIMDYHGRNRKHFYEAARHTMEIELRPYCDSIAKEIGCYPSLTKVLWKFGFEIWKLVLFGVPTPMQVSMFLTQMGEDC